jgi:D-alanyl-D-alanine carboxypeptidase
LELIGDGGTLQWDDQAQKFQPWDETTFKGIVTQLVARGVKEILGPVHARASDPRWNHTPLPAWQPEDAVKSCSLAYPRAFILADHIACPTLISDGKNAHWSDPRVKNPIQVVPASGSALNVDWGAFPPGASDLTPILAGGQGQKQVLIPDSEALATALLADAIQKEPTLIWVENYSVSPSGNQVEESIAVDPLEITLSHFLKRSVNLVGETLLRSIGIHANGQGDALSAGSRAIMDYALRPGSTVRAGDFQLVDGCGLSLSTWATPEAMVSFLTDLESDTAFIAAFREFLAIPGGEGTLNSRFPGLSDWIRAKTGTLPHSGVHNLAGYVKQGSGSGWAPFAIFSQTDVGVTPDQAVSLGPSIVTKIDQVVTTFVSTLGGPASKRAKAAPSRALPSGGSVRP